MRIASEIARITSARAVEIQSEWHEGTIMHTVLFGSSKAYHVLWKDFRDATDPSGDDVEAGTSGFKDGDPERLGE